MDVAETALRNLGAVLASPHRGHALLHQGEQRATARRLSPISAHGATGAPTGSSLRPGVGVAVHTGSAENFQDPTDDEVDFARSYLIGSMPFHVATARQRMQLAVRDAVFDLPSGYTARLPEA